MQKATTVALDSYIIDRKELLSLDERKLLPKWLFVFFAIKINYGDIPQSQLITIDIDDFCEEWEIIPSDFHAAIAQLNKKGALAPMAKQLTLFMSNSSSED